MKYMISTDKDYFDRFGHIAERVRILGSLFQNQDTTATEDELVEWQDAADEVESDLAKLIYEAQYRVKRS